jgi:hypothetical protein
MRKYGGLVAVRPESKNSSLTQRSSFGTESPGTGKHSRHPWVREWCNLRVQGSPTLKLELEVEAMAVMALDWSATSKKCGVHSNGSSNSLCPPKDQTAVLNLRRGRKELECTRSPGPVIHPPGHAVTRLELEGGTQAPVQSEWCFFIMAETG